MKLLSIHVLVALSLSSTATAGAATVMLAPVADGFVREVEPTLNYGGAGLLCAAGVDSTNGAGAPRGRFDSLIRFDASEAAATFDATYGAGGWSITAVELHVTESAAPNNPLFP